MLMQLIDVNISLIISAFPADVQPDAHSWIQIVPTSHYYNYYQYHQFE